MRKRTSQLILELRDQPRWGGRRSGAGRKRGPISRDPHRRRARLPAYQPCHVTIKVRRGVPSLRTHAFVRELERSLRQACERGRFRITHYSIQRDHLHAIVEATSAHDLACGMKSLCARLARAVNRVFRRRGAVLFDRFHLHVLRTPREVRHAIAYVLCNARRHAAKLGRLVAGLAEVDPASSGRWFDGWNPAGPTAHDPPTIAAPRTWLLSIGWRRHGLILVDEIPGSRDGGGHRRH